MLNWNKKGLLGFIVVILTIFIFSFVIASNARTVDVVRGENQIRMLNSYFEAEKFIEYSKESARNAGYLAIDELDGIGSECLFGIAQDQMQVLIETKLNEYLISYEPSNRININIPNYTISVLDITNNNLTILAKNEIELISVIPDFKYISSSDFELTLTCAEYEKYSAII